MTTEEKLKEMLGDYYEMGVPGSPNAAILQNMLGADNELRDPQSENEALLKLIYEDVIGAVYDARDEAQAAAEAAGDAADAVANKADAIVNTASGSIASFSDGADDVPVKSLKLNIEPIQAGSGDPSPQNIRPISGHTGADVVRTGVNVWDEEWENGTIDNDTGEVKPYNAYFRSKNFIPVKPGVSYYVKSTSDRLYFYCYGSTQNYLGGSSRIDNKKDTVITTPNGCYYVKFVSIDSGTLTGQISINYPTTDHDYHAYTGTTIPITWQSEAGTVYGGTVDVTNGVLTVDMALVDLGTLDWTYNSGYGVNPAFYSNSLMSLVKHPAGNNAANFDKWYALCSMLQRTYADWLYVNNQDGYFSINAVGQIHTRNSSYTDAATFKVAVTGQTLCYELATPIEYTLTAEELSTLYGENNVWNSAGDTEVEYRADTKLYIENLTQPGEDDMTANANISSGVYFMVGNDLFLSTASIAAGEAIVPGTNCTATNLAAALNALNS